MKLTVSDRVEQGTARGVMLFKPGVGYPIERQGDQYLVTHEPRTEMRRKPRAEGETGPVVREPVQVMQTLVPQAVIDKLAAVAKIEE